LQAGDNRSFSYLAVNPGKVPAIDHDGVVITEAAATAYLADAFQAPIWLR
jgi:glutathione S-transferase